MYGWKRKKVSDTDFEVPKQEVPKHIGVDEIIKALEEKVKQLKKDGNVTEFDTNYVLHLLDMKEARRQEDIAGYGGFYRDIAAAEAASGRNLFNGIGGRTRRRRRFKKK
jgi:hypothetical protein